MMNNIIKISAYTVLACMSFVLSTTQGAPNALEKHLAVGASVAKSEETVQWLLNGSDTFLSLFESNRRGQALGGVILLPPLLAHPDWPGVISTLRNRLPYFGWSTLSIQLPVLEDTNNIKDYLGTINTINRRINASIDYFNNQGINNITIIGQGFGAAAGAAFLAENQAIQNKVRAFIGISLSGYSNIGGWLYSPNSLKRIALPVLDIYGSHDQTHVINSADSRSDAARYRVHNEPDKLKLAAFAQSATAKSSESKRGGYIAYRRIIISGADTYFSGAEERLLKRIVGWLKQNAKSAIPLKP